jgi:hypothetical protein
MQTNTEINTLAEALATPEAQAQQTLVLHTDPIPETSGIGNSIQILRAQDRMFYHMNNCPGDRRDVAGTTYIIGKTGSWQRVIPKVHRKKGKKPFNSVRNSRKLMKK